MLFHTRHESRQEISTHRRNEHDIVRKIKCKFYPDCIDQDECFFVHKESTPQSEENGNRQYRYCVQGEECQNQSCEFDETKHKNMKDIMCRFQARCNRSECAFKHIVERASFLGNCTQNYKRK